MIDLEPLYQLPPDIQRDWLATLQPPASHRAKGVFHLAAARRSLGGYEEGRITTLVVDENGFPMPGVRVAFAFDTADSYTVTEDFLWTPPAPRKANIFPTHGSGEIDHVQGSVVKDGYPGGVTVYVLEPQFASWSVAGAGMLANHTGLHLTFVLKRPGVLSFQEQLDNLAARIEDLEAATP